MTKSEGRGRRIALWAIGIVAGVLVLALAVINIYVHVAYHTYYSEAQREFNIPGIHEGFVCQDLDYYDEASCWLFSGYDAGGGVSPLYRRDADGSVARFYAKLPDGSVYDDHGSAITTTDDHAFLACEDGYLVFNAADMGSVAAGGTVSAIAQVDLEITPAFMNVEGDTLYAGTFHLIPSYPAPDEHHLIAFDGTENAGVILAYPADASGPYGFATQAAYVYSIPDAVQGMCELPNGDIVLSSSYGLTSSHLRTYDAHAARQGDAFLVDGRAVPLYFLDGNNLVADLVAPPMSEGIETHDGRIWISEESAGNKYLFGKLYGAGSVYSIPAE
ncbi:MAG: hypothetical protein V8R08_00250 [Coriobacteriales bacterium]